MLVNRAFPEIERGLKADGLLAVQYGILVALARSQGQTLTLSELADVANTSQSRLTHRMRDLIDQGYVSVSESLEDKRVKFATLTKAGLRRLEQVAPAHAEAVQSVIFDHLTPEQTRALADALSSIALSQCDHEEFRQRMTS